MKQYVIDELRLEDYQTLKKYLDENFKESGVNNLYWIPLDANILSSVQAEHKDCQPFYFSLELEENRISCELLIRTPNRMRCQCMDYATTDQRNWLIESIDAILEKLNIKL